MNKDVVYIEPEDDITDIIARVKGAKQKLVALVPPKKIGVLRSAVNTKLIAKAAKAQEKVVVIVTTDPSLMKLAATAGIPVAKTLQSRPKVPSEIIEEEKNSGEQVIDESDYDDEDAGADADKPAAPAAMPQMNRVKPQPADQEISSDDLEKDSEKEGKKKKNAKIPSLEKYRKWIIAGGVAFVALVIFLVWAFAFAPAATIAVSMRTTSNNFSENVSFTTKNGDADPESGIFYLEQQKLEKTSSVEFNATGEKNVGEKAKGDLTLTAVFKSSESPNITIDAGTVFTHGDYSYTSTSKLILENPESCSKADYRTGNCKDFGDVSVVANESGERYNIGAYDSGWSTPDSSVSVANNKAFTGGTDKTVTVVSEADFNSAKDKLTSEGREDGRTELTKKFGEDMVVIDSSLDVSTSDPKSTPAIGEEVKSGEKPKVEATTTFTMYAVDKTALETFIKKKSESSVAADQRIYAITTPFFENFQKDGDKFTAKLKSSTQTGPKVTEEDVLEKSKGKKLGEVQSLLKSINGVSSVKISTSVPWVSTIPNDPNKITIELKVEE